MDYNIPKPITSETPCYTCGSTKFYVRDKGYGRASLCWRCHPPTEVDLEKFERTNNESNNN